MFKVDKEKCIGCGLCVKDCLVKDIEIVDKKANIKNEDIEIKITFNLTIILEDGKKYAATISTKLPSGDVVENGNTSEEITDLKDVVFKRI